jgi:hypothetical protein
MDGELHAFIVDVRRMVGFLTGFGDLFADVVIYHLLT